MGECPDVRPSVRLSVFPLSVPPFSTLRPGFCPPSPKISPPRPQICPTDLKSALHTMILPSYQPTRLQIIPLCLKSFFQTSNQSSRPQICPPGHKICPPSLISALQLAIYASDMLSKPPCLQASNMTASPQSNLLLYVLNIHQHPKMCPSRRLEIHPLVLQDTSPLGPLPRSRSTSSLHHSKHGHRAPLTMC